MRNLDQRIKEIDRQLKDLPFKVRQSRIFLKASLEQGIKGLVDFDSYLSQ